MNILPEPSSINSAVEHVTKPVVLATNQPDGTWMGKHIKWLKQERSGIDKIGIKFLEVLEVFVLAISVIGLFPLIKGIQESKCLDAEKQFFKQAEGIEKPSNQPIEMKTQTRTFNHIHEFAIEKGLIWCRLRHSQNQNEWKPIYFDGFREKLSPQSISCDGANLVVLDQNNRVHYKKVIREFRNTEINQSNQHKVKGVDSNLDKTPYLALDKSQKNNWKDKWFSLPFIHPLVNLFTSKRLQIPLDAKAWAISHRGRYNNYLEDQMHHHHLVEEGVTTLYVLDANGKDIIKYDPWSPKNVKISIPVQETAKKTFEAENMSASASTLMLVGYETEQTEQGITKTLQIVTRLADIDSEGWNPGLKYDYFEHVDDPAVRVVPLESWKTHPLKMDKNSYVTKKITIIQTGEGNQARELRIEGVNQGKQGYYFKKIDEADWHFEESDQVVNSQNEALSMVKVVPQEKVITTVHDYQSQKAVFKQVPQSFVTANLIAFGQRSFRSSLKVTIEGQTFELDLYKKKTLKNFIGLEGDSYELVIPKELHQNSLIQRLFKNKKVIPVDVKEKESHLVLSSSFFQLNFQR